MVIGKILLFIGIGVASRMPQRMSPFSFGIELVSLVTVVSAILYGPIAGAFVGAICFVISGFYTREPPHDVLVAIVGMTLLGWFAPAVYSYFGSLGMTALFLTVLYDFGTNLVYIFLGHNFVNCLRFSALHIPSNYLLITYLGPTLIGL